MKDLRERLQELFGLDDFRPAQREVIQDVLGGRDVLCVMPTGAGKSLCYQFPAAVAGGMTIVVSPLISLMEDQVQQLRDEGINAALLNSSLTPAMQREAIAQIQQGNFEGLLYVAPERFFAPNFEPLLESLHVKLLAVDEAHCISHWGHDFRPEYARLGEVRKKLGMPTTIALTATATQDVRADIIRGLELREPDVFITGFDRPNLSYQCRRISKRREKDAALLDLLTREAGSAIVYCGTRKAVDEIVEMFGSRIKGRRIFGYHAGMDQASRTASQEGFMQTPQAIAVATNAFGMGINKPDIRLVIHYNLPGTLEAYYQEAGRAGRDGLGARCILLFNYQDRVLQEFFIEKIGQENNGDGGNSRLIAGLKQRATHKLDLMLRYAQTHRCRRQAILDYFGDDGEVAGCGCDVCAASGDGQTAAMASPTVLTEELVRVVRQILSAIARLNGRFGVGGVAEVLTGQRSERTARWQLDQLSVFGLLKHHPTKRIIAMVHRIIESGLARQKDVGMPDRPRYVVELTAAGTGVMKGLQPPPASLADLIPTGAQSRVSGGSSRVVRNNPKAIHKGQAADDSPQMDAEAGERFERLRAARIKLARERHLPPYCICHDSTLQLIACDAPDSLARLEQIRGMGPHKVRMYGRQLLEAVGSRVPTSRSTS